MAHGLPAIEAHSTLLCMQMAKKLEQLGWLPDLVSRLCKPSVLFAASCTCNIRVMPGMCAMADPPWQHINAT